MKRFPRLALAALLAPGLHASTRSATEWKFDFVSAQPRAGFIAVAPDAAYDANKHFGYRADANVQPDQPKVFAVDLPEGNYEVAVRMGDARAETSTTIKAESRRLMLHSVATAPGAFVERTFTVNVRQPVIAGTGASTSLNGREIGPPIAASWDGQLTLEFNGAHPGVASVTIKPAPDALTVFLAGDSTVTDQRNEPFAGWGQMLPSFFAPGVAISNHAESGLSLRSFERQKRLQKILSMLKRGDYVFIQFGHNDQKEKGENVGPFTSYKASLTSYVAAVREKGGQPVLVTPMERRRWEAGVPKTTLHDYAEAVRQVAAEQQTPLIDLNAMSLKFYAALGEEGSKRAFVFYPKGSFGQDREFKDNTHHNNYGGYELARCIVEGIKAAVPALAKHLAPAATAVDFDPAKPDLPESVAIPLSPLKGPAETPAGS